MSGIAWSDLMRFGLGDLRLPPEVFWSLTPVELMLMAGTDTTAPVLDRAGLDALMAAFPDTRDGGDNG